ncbi:thiol reductant ABC exporter subunit CydD [Arsenicicoccus sp. oral taxon 190]|uniref:thiol reductant ABC exporter subunit CydD n=1 Tax=Arsenicicoccus sp. oral taxon 190 TaxID=1658671 RepID=UPI00067A12AD|nr:thiol reductant ABC exporter subunit CydD [Arsenicicoccus sp. oral taxon 190]AKT50602.1 ABC transporter [Arsenicicoccus sp. oral taxon 190]
MKPFDPRLLQLLPGARRDVLALGLVGTAQGVAAIGQAFAVAAVVVTVVRGGSVLPAVMWLAGVLVIRAVLTAANEIVASRAGTRVSCGLRELLLRTWLAHPADYRPAPAAAQTLAAQGTTSIETYVARYLPALVAAGALPVMAVVTLAFVDLWSALIVVLTLPLLPLFAALIGHATADASGKRWQAMAALGGHFLDMMRGLPTLAGYGRAERQTDTIRDVSVRHRRATVATLRLAFLSSAALELLATISVALVAVSVGIRLTWGSIELGPGLAAILLAPEAYWPIRRVGQEFHNAADGAEALAAVADAASTPTPPPTCSPDRGRLGSPGDQRRPRSREGRGSREIKEIVAALVGVGYAYPGATTEVLRDLTLRVPRGLTVVTGPSGAGKTTALELLCGLRRPTSGTARLATSAHLVTQRPFLTSGSIRSNLTLGAGKIPDADLLAALDQVGLGGLVRGLDDGLATALGDDGFGLSAGQRARLGVARALLSDAPLIALDEPTAHLDPHATALVDDVLRTLAERRAVVVVTHRPGLVAVADQHVTLPSLVLTEEGAR